MTRYHLSLLCLLSLAVGAVASPQEAVAAACRDASKLPPDVVVFTRYLTSYAFPSEGLPPEQAFHFNMLSSQVRIAIPRPCGPHLYAVDLRDYGWGVETWEKLAEAEPYFHVRVTAKAEYKEVTRYREVKSLRYDTYGRGYYVVEKEPYKDKELVASPAPRPKCAPWVEGADYDALSALTRSKVPVVRLDWFVTQTAVAADREAGYYDWLGVKDEKTFQQLVGFDKAAAQKVYREVAAVVPPGVSGVAQHGRQVFRFGTVAGSWWESRDVLVPPVKERNPVDALDGDYKFQAKEVFATLPNGLWAYGLFDAEGKLQDSAPPEIGGDTTSTSRDPRIHNPLSCIRCHKEGLRPIDDYARRVFRQAVKLGSKDKDTQLRLQQLYLEPLDVWYSSDNAAFSAALARIGGKEFTPEKLAGDYRLMWKEFYDDPVTPERLALEIGCTAETLTKALKRYAEMNGLPLQLAELIADRPRGIPRTSVEEHFALIVDILGTGYGK